MYSKVYEYRITDIDGNYLGRWHDVISAPTWNHEINSAGSVLDLELARTSNYGVGTDCAIGNRVEIRVFYGEIVDWITDVPDTIINEDSDNIVLSVGSPAGRLIFSGLITRVIPKFGNDTVVATIASRGIELDNIVIEEPIPALDVRTPTDGGQLFGNYKTAGDIAEIAQVFTAPNTGILLGIQPALFSYDAYFGASDKIILELYEGDNPSTDTIPANLLATSEMQGKASGIQLLSYTLSDNGYFVIGGAVQLIETQKYFFLLRPSPAFALSSGNYPLWASGLVAGTYTGGNVWRKTVPSTWTEQANTQIGLKLIMSGGDTTVTYSSDEISDTLKAILDISVTNGGVITYDDDIDSVEVTGVTSSFSFNTNTVLEGINKVLQQAPSDWYWYVNLGTNTLFFKPLSSEPDIYITKGKEIQSLELEESLESVVNTVFFSGGEISPGVNLFIKRSDGDSITTYGSFTERVSDNRVTLTESAELIANSILQRQSQPRYKTTLTLTADKIDIENIHVGMIVKFLGFDNYIDNLTLQIVSLSYAPDQITVSLDSLLPKVSRTVDNLRRQLLLQETQNNPSSPS